MPPTVVDVVTNLDSLDELFGLNPTTIGDVIVDIVTDYSAPREAEITERPIQGRVITNARNIRPQELTMTCIMTDPDFSGGNVARAALSGSLGNLTTSWRDKRDRLDVLFESNEPITVTTYEKTYDNMVITSILPDRRPQTSNAYFFTISFRQVDIVQSSFFDIDPDLIPDDRVEQQTIAQQTKPPKANRGNTASTTPTAEQDSSLLSSLTGVGST